MNKIILNFLTLVLTTTSLAQVDSTLQPQQQQQQARSNEFSSFNQQIQQNLDENNISISRYSGYLKDLDDKKNKEIKALKNKLKILLRTVQLALEMTN